MGVEAEDADIWSTYTDRDDDLLNEDVVEFFIDPEGDAEGYMEFEVSPRNTIFDSWIEKPLFSQEGPVHVDWNAISLRTAVRVEGTLGGENKNADERNDTDVKWVMGAALPWEDCAIVSGVMALPPNPGDTWRMNVTRYDYGKVDSELSQWSPSHVKWAWHEPKEYGYITFVAYRTVTLPDMTGRSGDTITVSVSVDDATGIAGVELVLSYDPNLLTATGAQPATLTSGFEISYRIHTGKIAITMAQSTGITGGSGTLVNMSLQVSEDISPEATCPLTLTKVSLYDEDTQSISAAVRNGMFTVAQVNRSPELAAIGNKVVDEGKELRFTVSATDPDEDELSYSASNVPSGAMFDAATRTFSWTPGYDQSGTYAGVRFEVSDGALTDSEDIIIAVNETGGALEPSADQIEFGDVQIDATADQVLAVRNKGDTESFILKARGIEKGAAFF